VKLGPALGDAKRGEYLSWLFYRPGVMEPAFMERRMGFQHVQGAMGWAKTEEVEEVLNSHLAKNKYFLGDEFSAADIMLGGGIYYMMLFKMTPETDVFKEYTARITARPAFKKAMEM
jgi:glutathione S-transferase